jgi:hypothetical protein
MDTGWGRNFLFFFLSFFFFYLFLLFSFPSSYFYYIKRLTPINTESYVFVRVGGDVWMDGW